VVTRVIARSSDPVPRIRGERMHRDVQSRGTAKRVNVSHDITGSTLTWVFGGHWRDPDRHGVVIYNATGLPLCQTCNYLSEMQREDHTRSRWYAEVPLMGRTVLEIVPWQVPDRRQPLPDPSLDVRPVGVNQ